MLVSALLITYISFSTAPDASSRSRIPVFRGATHNRAPADFDAATCVSALTVDDESEQFSFNSQPSKQRANGGNYDDAAPQPAVKKKKKKKQPPVWKMQPIETRAYVPLPQETGSVEQR